MRIAGSMTEIVGDELLFHFQSQFYGHAWDLHLLFDVPSSYLAYYKSFNSVLDLRKSQSDSGNDLCIPETTNGFYDAYLRMEKIQQFKDRMPDIARCKKLDSRGSYNGKNIRCDPITRELSSGDKVIIGCKAVLI